MVKTELQIARMNAVYHKKQMEYFLAEIEILTGKKVKSTTKKKKAPPKSKWDKAYDNLFGT